MSNAKVLLIGSGGREHALAWALARSPQVGHVYVAPGNAGTAFDQGAPTSNVDIQAGDTAALLAFARDQGIALTVVGPEAPLAAGVVDAFQAAGLRIFGPTCAAAQLEASKAFSKTFMREHGIPTAAHVAFADYASAVTYLQAASSTGHTSFVVKADGLAAGKGVIVCDDIDAATAALKRTMLDREFGAAGNTVIIEERLSGPEVSVLAFSDGRSVLVMPSARDHKRIFDNDEGPNTGGMGAYAPIPGIDAEWVERVRRTVLQPTIDGMAARGTPYVGVLYAGLMLTADGPKTLEFNCRFGDPETQVILPLLDQAAGRDAPASLFEIMLACAQGQLDQVAPRVQWRPGACATVVLAARGYPGAYPKGLPITGLDEAARLDDVVVFHAGSALKDGQPVTAGGRVLAVSALGNDLPAALRRAYSAVECIHFDGMHYRKDIGRLKPNVTKN
ncbi:MAG: phosphoribosylamine--glycine ligase [Chloroflexi bacterium]|nr:phosphoribosylamine--glycine ligase [Chloroflexota bacterium]